MYALEMGPLEAMMIRNAEQARQPIPDKILNKPELHLGLELYYYAFFELDSERSHTQATTRLTRSQILKYADDEGFDEDQRNDLLYYIRAIDIPHCDNVENKKVATAKAESARNNRRGKNGR